MGIERKILDYCSDLAHVWGKVVFYVNVGWIVVVHFPQDGTMTPIPPISHGAA